MNLSHITGENMKIVEDYAQRKVEETQRKFIINLDKKGLKTEEIAEIVEVSPEFVNKVLSE